MGVLGRAALFILLGGRRGILGSVGLYDQSSRRLLRLVRDAGRVGAHVGNQADVPLAGDFDSLIKLLRHLHRPFGVKAELPRGFLL